MKKTLLLMTAAVLVAISIIGADVCRAKDPVEIRLQDWELSEDVLGREWTKIIKKFESQNPDIRVRLEPVANAQKTVKYITQTEAGEAPDIAKMTDEMVVSFLGSGKPYFLDLEAFISKEGGDTFKRQFFKASIDLAQKGGRAYALPCQWAPLALVYNKNLLKEAGFDAPPATWDDFLNYCKKLTIDKNRDGRIDQWGYGITGTKTGSAMMRLLPWFWVNDADILDPTETKAVINSPNAKQAFQYWVELYTKHHVIPPGAANTDFNTLSKQFTQQQVAMFVNGPWTRARIGLGSDLAKQVSAAAIPKNKKDATYVFGLYWAISAQTKHPEEAWKLLKYLSTAETQIETFKTMELMSPRIDVASNPLIRDDAWFGSFVKLQSVAKPTPKHPQWARIMDVVLTAQQRALIGEVTPSNALDEAQKEIEKIIK